MAQEFTIKSEQIEEKINQLLPTQGGFQPGVDFSASTMVVPIVDLTETAEGSQLRQDLQTAFSHTQSTSFDVTNATTTVISTTGYYRVTAVSFILYQNVNASNSIIINDGASDKTVWLHSTLNAPITDGTNSTTQTDTVVKLQAGDSLVVKSDSGQSTITGCVRQIADLSGNLINP
jgi:hypothetical protein